MKLIQHTAAFAVTTILPVLADSQVTTATTATPELTTLCPKLDGKSIANRAGAKYSVSCDWIMEAEGKAVKVEGKTTPLICMEACEESDDCYSINIQAGGACSLVSGKEKGMRSSTGSINLFRLPQASSTTTPVQITTTGGATASNAVSTTHAPRPITTTVSAASAASAIPAAHDVCDLSLTNLCPACDNTIAADASGNSYQIFCDKSLFTNRTYSVQSYLTVEGCMKQCDDLGWCLGASYYDDRNCEIARGPLVYVQPEAGYTAFLPVHPSEATATTVAAVSSVSIKSVVVNSTTTSLTPDPTVTILPISNLCNTSALTCPACDGVIVEDALNQTYTALCTFAPVCDRLAFATGPLLQDECMQDCDQDGTCLAVLWYTDRNACQFCQQGLDGGPGSALDFVLLVADIDGDGDGPESVSYSTTASSNWTSTTTYPTTTSSSTTLTTTDSNSTSSSVTAISSPAPYLPPSYPTGSLRAPAPYSSRFAISTTTSPLSTTYSTRLPTTTPYSSSTATSVTTSPSFANTTRSAAVPNISAVVCPGLGSGVFIDSTDSHIFDVKCDGIITAAQSRFTTASNLAACVASCVNGCDGVQFGYSSRCGLYQDISTIGPGTGWTVATSMTYPSRTQLSMTATAVLT